MADSEHGYSTSIDADSFFTGREDEIAVFENILFLQNNNDPINRHFALSVTGEAGIGKSSLINEFGRIAAANDAVVIHGKCMFDALLPYCMWGKLLNNLLGITDKTRLTYKKFTKLLSNRIDFAQLGESAYFLADILSIELDKPSLKTLSDRDHLFEIQIAFQRLLELLSQKKKLVVILDDLQWIDSACLRILNALFRNCITDYPIIFVLSQRPEDDEKKNVVLPLNPDFVRIEHVYLGGIRAESAKEIAICLIAETTGSSCSDMSEDLLSFLIYTSKNNPLFLKQTTVNFLDSGRIIVKEMICVFADETVLAPTTLTGNALFRACLKNCSNEIINVLRPASVLGIEFNLKELQQVLRFLNRNYKHETLERFMSETNLVEYSHRNSSSLLHFQHALVRDCIYDDIQPIEKELLHCAAAGALIKMHSDTSENISGIIAYHYLHGNNREQTIKWGTKTFLQAKRAYQNNKALLWADILIKNLKDTGVSADKLFNILSLKSEIFDVLGKRTEHLATVEQMIKIATESGDELLQLKAKRKYAWFLSLTGEFKEAEKYLLDILDRIPVDSRSLKRIVLSSLASVYNQQGQLKKSLTLHKESLELARELQDSDGESKTLINLGGVFKSLGRYNDAGECYGKSLEFMKTVGNRRMISIIYGNLAVLNNEQKKYDEALDNYNNALEMTRIIGNHRNEGTILGNLGVLYENLGRTEEALNLYKQSLEIARETRNLKHEGILLANIGVIHLKREEYEQAEELLLQAKDIASNTKDNALECFLSVALADVHFNVSNIDEAISYFRNACRIIERYDFGMTANYECLLDLRERALKAGLSSVDFPYPSNWKIK